MFVLSVDHFAEYCLIPDCVCLTMIMMYVNEVIGVIHFMLAVTEILYQFNFRRLYSDESDELFQISLNVLQTEFRSGSDNWGKNTLIPF